MKKRSLLVLPLLLLQACLAVNKDGAASPKTAGAAAMDRLWARQAGTPGEDFGRGVAADGSGNIYVTGDTSGGLDGNAHAGADDVFLIKYDPEGNKLWTKQAGTPGHDYGYGVALDGAGNIYIAGYTDGGLEGNANAGGYDVFLSKYDPDGNRLWTKQAGTSSDDCARGVAADGTGNIYVTGYTKGGFEGNVNAGYTDIFLSKYDSRGNKLWTRQTGTSNVDESYGVAVDGAGNILITGDTGGGLEGNANAGFTDVFLSKYDPAGNRLWTRQAGTVKSDYGYEVAADGPGNIYVVGYTEGGLEGNSSAGGYDVFLAKYGPGGNRLWTIQAGTASHDYGYGVALDGPGNIYVTGYTEGGLDGNVNAGSSDIFLSRYDSGGKRIWTKQAGASNFEYGHGIAADGSGNIYLTGGAGGGLDGNPGAGGYDIFLIGYGPSKPAR